MLALIIGGKRNSGFLYSLSRYSTTEFAQNRIFAIVDYEFNIARETITPPKPVGGDQPKVFLWTAQA